MEGRVGGGGGILGGDGVIMSTSLCVGRFGLYRFHFQEYCGGCRMKNLGNKTLASCLYGFHSDVIMY